jgi:hypothetical protein
LKQEKLIAAEFPVAALGNILGSAASSIIECVQCPDAMAGQSVLAAASLATQGLADVEIDGRVCPISLFCLTIAGSGDRKSAADSLALKVHSQFQKELFQKHDEREYSYLNEKDVYEAQQKSIKSDKSLNDDQKIKYLNDLAQPNKPTFPILIVQEPTLEGLQKSFEMGRPSQALFNDEGGQFFGGHAMSSDNALKSMAGLSKFWDGKEIIRTRAGVGESLALYDKRLSVHLMIQPIVAEKVLHDPLLKGQGFLPRFLISWPDSIAGARLYNYKDPTQDFAIQRYWEVMSNCLNLSLPKESEQRRKILLSDKAKELWVEAYNSIEQKLVEKGEYEHIRSTASKTAENIARMAGVLALIDNQEAEVIDQLYVEQAIFLGEYYLKEILRLDENLTRDKYLKEAELLLDWMMKSGKRQFSVRVVSRESPRKSRARAGKDSAMKLINILVEYGWLRYLKDGAVIDGKKCKDAWELTQK